MEGHRSDGLVAIFYVCILDRFHGSGIICCRRPVLHHDVLIEGDLVGREDQLVLILIGLPCLNDLLLSILWTRVLK